MPAVCLRAYLGREHLITVGEQPQTSEKSAQLVAMHISVAGLPVSSALAYASHTSHVPHGGPLPQASIGGGNGGGRPDGKTQALDGEKGEEYGAEGRGWLGGRNRLLLLLLGGGGGGGGGDGEEEL